MQQTIFLGKSLYEFASLDSTNNYAATLLAEGNPAEGTVIVTHDQYAGKGQLTNKWESEPYKNLTFSVILYPKFLLARQQFLLNQAISVSVLEALLDYLTSGVTIKWPNDIYVKDKKITGILIQNSLQGSKLLTSVVGIGINVNQQKFLSDAPNPTSIILEKRTEVKLNELLDKICNRLENNYLRLKMGDTKALHEKYLNNLYRFQEKSNYAYPDGTHFTGTIVGITDTGKLTVDTPQGRHDFGFKEIKYIL